MMRREGGNSVMTAMLKIFINAAFDPILAEQHRPDK